MLYDSSVLNIQILMSWFALLVIERLMGMGVAGGREIRAFELMGYVGRLCTSESFSDNL